MCACIISPQDFSRKRYRCTAQKSTLCQSDVMDHVVGIVVAQEMMLRRNGNFSAAHHNRDNRVSVCNSMMPSQNLTLSAVTHSPLSFIHKMSDQYFITGCFSRSGVKKIDSLPVIFMSLHLAVHLQTCGASAGESCGQLATAIYDCGFNATFDLTLLWGSIIAN